MRSERIIYQCLYSGLRNEWTSMNKIQLINASIDYIIEHFEEELSIENVADHFHYSKYYFCHTFKEVTGESVYSFIKRLKLDQSAIDIKLDKNKKITDIGMDYGYSSSNYSSAFSKHHQVSPYEFRQASKEIEMRNPFYPNGMIPFKAFEEYNTKITIQEISDFFVVYERMIGSYKELRERWFTFLETYKSSINEDTVMIEKFYNDPAITDLNRCICDMCMTVSKTCALEHTMTIKGGRFAIYRYEGEIQNIFYTLQGIFNVWMPESGYKMDQRYGLNIYRNIDIENEYVIMDLCIPIK